MITMRTMTLLGLLVVVGLLAGCNDMELLARSEVGRDINRHYYTPAEVEAALRLAHSQLKFEIVERLPVQHPVTGTVQGA